MASDEWEAGPKFHFGHFQRGYCWTHSTCSLDDYIELWRTAIGDAGEVPRDHWNDTGLGSKPRGSLTPPTVRALIATSPIPSDKKPLRGPGSGSRERGRFRTRRPWTLRERSRARSAKRSTTRSTRIASRFVAIIRQRGLKASAGSGLLDLPSSFFVAPALFGWSRTGVHTAISYRRRNSPTWDFTQSMSSASHLANRS